MGNNPCTLGTQETLMGKGSWKRPCCTTKEEQDLRDKYARGKMTFLQYERAYRKLLKQGLIERNGKTLS